MEGAGPTAHELAALHTFLAQWTNKPGGITIKVDDVIPPEIARRRTKNALALEYLDGPVDRSYGFYIAGGRDRSPPVGTRQSASVGHLLVGRDE